MLNQKRFAQLKKKERAENIIALLTFIILAEFLFLYVYILSMLNIIK